MQPHGYTAPMSGGLERRLPCWSRRSNGSLSSVGSPALRAGLLLVSPNTGDNGVLKSGGVSPGSATPTRLWFVPLTSPPEPPVPIRLYELLASSVPETSDAAVPLSLRLPATMLLCNSTLTAAASP